MPISRREFLIGGGAALAGIAACGIGEFVRSKTGEGQPVATPGRTEVTPTPTGNPTGTPAGETLATVVPAITSTPESTQESELLSYNVFRPRRTWDLEALRNAKVPTYKSMLASHGLTFTDIQEVKQPNVSWEPGLHVVELTQQNYGNKTIPLLEGYVYTVALKDGRVEILWGGDPRVPAADVQWGFSARWVPRYENNEGDWFNIDDPRELAVREYRFGRYLRSQDMQGVRADVLYFNRFGPYYTGVGNLDTQGWEPPSIDSTVPRNYLDACAMLGGLSNESEWTYGERASDGYLNWSWRYSKKVPGSANYCRAGDPCWQTVYVPEGRGYVEIWLSEGTTGPNGKPVESAGPYKFFAEARPILADSFHNIDEFSYHADPSR